MLYRGHEMPSGARGALWRAHTEVTIHLRNTTDTVRENASRLRGVFRGNSQTEQNRVGLPKDLKEKAEQIVHHSLFPSAEGDTTPRSVLPTEVYDGGKISLRTAMDHYLGGGVVRDERAQVAAWQLRRDALTASGVPDVIPTPTVVVDIVKSYPPSHAIFSKRT